MRKMVIFIIIMAIFGMSLHQTSKAESFGEVSIIKLSSENAKLTTGCYITENYAIWLEQIDKDFVLMAYDLKSGDRFRLSTVGGLGYQSENRLYASGDYCAFFRSIKTERGFITDVYGYDIKNRKEYKLNKKEGHGQNLTIWQNYVAWPDYGAGILLADIKKPNKAPTLISSNKSIIYLQADNGYVVWEYKEENSTPDPTNWNIGQKIMCYEIATGKTQTIAQGFGLYSSSVISGNYIYYTAKNQVNSFFCAVMGYNLQKKESFTVLEMSPVGTYLHMNPNSNFLLIKNGTNHGSFGYDPQTKKLFKVASGSYWDFYSGGCAWGDYSVSCRTASPPMMTVLDSNNQPIKQTYMDVNLELFDARDNKTIALADARLGIGYRTRCRTNGEFVIFEQRVLPKNVSEIMLVKVPKTKMSTWATNAQEIRTALPAQIIAERDNAGIAIAKIQTGELVLTFENPNAANSNIIKEGNMCYLVGVMGKNSDGNDFLNVEVSVSIKYEFPRTGETKGICGTIIKKNEDLGKLYITDSDGYDWIIKYKRDEQNKLFWDEYLLVGNYITAFGWVEEDDAGYKVMTAYGVSNRNSPCITGYDTAEIVAENSMYFKNDERNAFNLPPIWAKEDILIEIESLYNILGAETSIKLSDSMEIIFYVKRENHRIYLTPGSTKAMFDDKEFELTSAPIKTDSTLMVPLGIIASRFGAECELRSEEKKLSIRMKKIPWENLP